MLKFITVSSVAGVTALAVYAAARDFRANELLVSINEFVRLDAADSQSFTDLATPVEGEIRFEANTTSVCKFLLKLNAALSNRSFFPVSSSPLTEEDGTPMSPNKAKGSFNASASSASTSSGAVPLSGLEVNDIVDVWQLQKKHVLVFSPACTSHQTLMRYNSVVHEEFSVPISARDVQVAKKGPGVFEVDFELCVHRAILDLEVLLTLPKGAKVLDVSTFGVGSWHPVQGTTSDVVWIVGACGGDVAADVATGKRGRIAGSEAGWTVATVARAAASRAASARPPPEKCAGGGVAPVQELADKTIARMEPLDAPHAPLGEFLEKVCFRMTYELVPTQGDGVESVGASSVSLGGTRKRSKKQNKHRGSGRRRTEEDDYVMLGRDGQETAAAAPSSDIPAITLSYCSASAASGLLVKRLQTLTEKVLWSAEDPQGAWMWRFAKRFFPNVDAPTKLSKKAQYTTRFSQSLAVLREWD